MLKYKKDYIVNVAKSDLPAEVHIRATCLMLVALAISGEALKDKKLKYYIPRDIDISDLELAREKKLASDLFDNILEKEVTEIDEFESGIAWALQKYIQDKYGKGDLFITIDKTTGLRMYNSNSLRTAKFYIDTEPKNHIFYPKEPHGLDLE